MFIVNRIAQGGIRKVELSLDTVRVILHNGVQHTYTHTATIQEEKKYNHVSTVEHNGAVTGS